MKSQSIQKQGRKKSKRKDGLCDGTETSRPRCNRRSARGGTRVPCACERAACIQPVRIRAGHPGRARSLAPRPRRGGRRRASRAPRARVRPAAHRARRRAHVRRGPAAAARPRARPARAPRPRRPLLRGARLARPPRPAPRAQPLARHHQHLGRRLHRKEQDSAMWCRHTTRRNTIRNTNNSNFLTRKPVRTVPRGVLFRPH